MWMISRDQGENIDETMPPKGKCRIGCPSMHMLSTCEGVNESLSNGYGGYCRSYLCSLYLKYILHSGLLLESDATERSLPGYQIRNWRKDDKVNHTKANLQQVRSINHTRKGEIRNGSKTRIWRHCRGWKTGSSKWAVIQPRRSFEVKIVTRRYLGEKDKKKSYIEWFRRLNKNRPKLPCRSRRGSSIGWTPSVANLTAFGQPCGSLTVACGSQAWAAMRDICGDDSLDEKARCPAFGRTAQY